MPNRTIHLYDYTVVTDDSRLMQLVARHERDHISRSTSREFVPYEATLFERQEERRIWDEQYTLNRAGRRVKYGSGRSKRCLQHRLRYETKRNMRRMAVKFRKERDDLTAAELLAEAMLGYTRYVLEY